MDRKDGLIHMILGEKRIRWGRGRRKRKKKEDSKHALATLLYILETDLTRKRFHLICICSKINSKKLVIFFSLSLAKKEFKVI